MKLDPWQHARFTKKARQWQQAVQNVSPERQANIARFVHALTGPWPNEEKRHEE